MDRNKPWQAWRSVCLSNLWKCEYFCFSCCSHSVNIFRVWTTGWTKQDVVMETFQTVDRVTDNADLFSCSLGCWSLWVWVMSFHDQHGSGSNKTSCLSLKAACNMFHQTITAWNFSDFNNNNKKKSTIMQLATHTLQFTLHLKFEHLQLSSQVTSIRPGK